MIEINLLGNFEVIYNGKTIDGFSTDKVRALFAYLVVEHDRPHYRQQLSTLLWPDQPDSRSRHNLRQALSNLKQTLPNLNSLKVTPKTILFQTQESIQIDVAAFSVLAKTCQHHRHESINTCLPCLQCQQKMLNLYRGEFLAHFPAISAEPFEEWLVITREAFHQLAIQSLNSLMNFHQYRGEFDQALSYSKQLTHFAPWNEEGYRKSMYYLAQQGKRSESLKEYNRCKEALNKEFGIPPTDGTQNLAEKIMGNTLEQYCPSPKPGLSLPSFIGRKQELAEIAERLANPDCRLLTLSGAGGSGKTRLALQSAEQHAGIFRDGIFFIPLVNVNNIAEAVQQIGNVLNLQVEKNPLKQICEHLHEKQLLLILDNFEHIISNCEVLSEIIQATTKVKILITSRERLCLHEEWVYTVEGLTYKTDDDEPEKSENDAILLFTLRAKQTIHNFQINDTNRNNILRICELVEGFPLGIELAASTVAHQPCKNIADTLENNLKALNSQIRNIPERHRNLQAAFDYSWKLLPKIEQQALSKLSIFIGPFSTAAAGIVTGTSNEILTGLVKRSLLKLSNDGLYGFHDVIHQFAREKCENPEPLFMKHARYYTEFIEQIENISSPEGVSSLQSHRTDILAAWKWIINNQVEIDLLTKLLPGILTIFTRIGPLSEGKILFTQTIQQLETIAKQNELIDQLAISIGQIDFELCEFDDVLENMQSIAEQSPFVHQHAQAKYILGQVYSTKGETETANKVLLQALTYSEDQNDLHLKMNILIELGRVSIRASAYELSMFYNQQALDLSQQINDLYGQASALTSIGTVYFYTGKLQQARNLSEQALVLYQKLKDRRNESRVCNNLSNIIAEMGDLSLSMVYSRKALEILSTMGNDQRKAFVLHNLGATYWELGDYYKAKQTYHKALNIYQTINIPHAAAEIYGNLAITEFSLGNYTKAKEYAEISIDITNEVDNKENLANAHYYLGKIEYQMGNLDQAKKILEHGLKIRLEIPHTGRIAEFYIILADISINLSDFETGISYCNSILEMIDQGEIFFGADDPLYIFYTLWKILTQIEDERKIQVLEKAMSLLQQRANSITDPDYRKMYLENVPSHRQLIAHYQEQQERISTPTR